MLRPELLDSARRLFGDPRRDGPVEILREPPARRRRWEAMLAAALFAAVVAFQVWTAAGTDSPPLIGGRQLDYNNRLMHSFLSGRLYLSGSPDPRLARLADPYDGTTRPADIPVPHDVSYYRGHYYLYFGVAPIVTLLLPWRLIVGHDLPQVYAVVLFVGIGYAAASLLWLGVRRRFFPNSHPAVLAAGLLVLGLGSMTHAVLRRTGVWEAAVAPGYAYAMITLFCLWRSLLADRPRLILLAAGAAFALAVGSRPIYVAGAAALLAPIAQAWWREGGPGGREWRRRLVPLLAGALPIAAGLAWYNWARFGNPLEFGNHYMLNAADERDAVHFSLRYLPFNAYVYYLAPLSWSRYFPFVELIRVRHEPAGYYGIEYVCGILANLPFAWLALGAALARRGRPAAESAVVGPLVAALALFFGGVALLDGCWWAAAARYMVDFTPSLMLLACVGLLAVERAAGAAWRRMAAGLGLALAAFTAFVGAMLGMQLHELLRQLAPDTYEAIAHAFDTPVWWVERLTGARFGEREVALRLPAGRTGAIECLVSTGCEFMSDHLLIHYYDDHRIRFGFSHAGFGVLWSRPVDADYGRIHLARISMGSFYPPRAHPFYDRRPRAFAERVTRGLYVAFDGQTAFNAIVNFNDASPGSVAFGDDPTGLYEKSQFTGKLLSVRRVGEVMPPSYEPGYGRIRMSFTLPTAMTGRALPLVALGRAGRGDVVSFVETRPGRVRFRYDHWGVGLWESGEIAISGGEQHWVDFRLPSLIPPGRRDLPPALTQSLLVEVDGEAAWLERVPYYPVDPNRTSLGRNALGASTCEPELPEGIAQSERIDFAPLVPDRAHGPVVLRLRWPSGAAGRVEPLLTAGVAGRADCLSVAYGPEGRAAFVLDHGGSPRLRSPTFGIDGPGLHEVEIALPGLDRPEAESGRAVDGEVRVSVDGTPVWRAPAVGWVARPRDIAVAVNPAGTTATSRVFGGELAGVRWPDVPASAP